MAEETTGTVQAAQTGAETPATGTEVNSPAETKTPEKSGNTTFSMDEVKSLIQKEVDRATNKLGNENKRLRAQLDEKLTDEEKKNNTLKEREADIAERDAEITRKENRFIALDAIKEAGLDDGGKNALALIDFVVTDNEEKTKERVKVFAELVNKFVSDRVDQTFKANGRTPDKGSGGEAKATNSVAEKLGKATADKNAAAQKVFNYYLGGRN